MSSQPINPANPQKDANDTAFLASVAPYTAAGSARAKSAPPKDAVVVPQPDSNGEFACPADGAKFMAALGIPQTPLKGKNPNIGGADWHLRASTDFARIDEWARTIPGCNFGSVAFAEIGKNFVFEIDSLEVRKRHQADTKTDFPKTLTIQSREGRGHRWYSQTAESIALGNISQENRFGDFSLRMNHEQAVSPGSVHPDTGKQYRVVVNTSPVVMPPADIAWLRTQKKLITKIDKSLTGKKIPHGEHDVTLFKIACSLRHDGLEEQGITACLVEVCEKRCEDYGDDYLEMCAAKAASACKYPPGTDKAVIFKNKKSAYGVEPAKVAQTSDSVSGSPTDDEPLPDFTSMLTGSIADYVRAVEPDFPPEFKVMSVVTRVGLALSGKVQMKGCTNLQPRFYTTLIAPAWYGKSGSIGETKAIDNTAWYDTALSIDSAPALVATFGYRAGYMNSPDSLCAPTVISPVRVLLLPDEMKDVFEKSKASKEAKGNIGTMLLRLFDSNEIGNNTKKTGKVEFTTAHFAMLGGATSEGYDAMWMNTSGALGGLQSRMTVVGTNNPQCPQKRREGNAEAAEAVRIRIVEQVRAANGFIYMTPEAESLMAVWWKEVEQHESAKRLSDIVRRYLIVLAVTNDTDTIDESLVFMGIAFGNHVLAVRAKYNPADATSAVQAFENRIIKAYERCGDLTNRELLRRVHPERYPGGDGAFNQARRNLVESGRVVKGTPCSVSQKDRWGLDKS